MMWWAMWCCAAAAAVCVRAAPPALPAIDLAQIEQSEPDDQQETLSYAVGPLSAHYAPEPWLYLLADLPRDSQGASGRTKRRMPSLSIDLPMAVLREKLSLEKERQHHAMKAAANRNYLNRIGKRGFRWASEVDPVIYY